ncbi:MAG: DUF1800 domain-containing protein [Rubrivivax sp.]|nr:DUF1800 domain-containing protein [Rubrivivax sp.]
MPAAGHHPFSRRQALRRLGALAGAAAATPLLLGLPDAQAQAQVLGPPGAGLDERSLALLNRLTWGANGPDAQRLQAAGPSHWLNRQLSGAPASLPPAVQAQIDRLSIVTQPPAERMATVLALRQRSLRAETEAERTAARDEFQLELTRQENEAATRQLLRAVHSPAQLQEQMQWFWFNHFNVFHRKGLIRALLADYEEQAIRPHALGDFRALLGAVTRHPAMLVYLDNQQNARDRGNENHARELLELHTLGVDGGYGQQDVQALARVMTGHGVRLREPDARAANPRRGQSDATAEGFYVFQANLHDDGEKTVLGHTLRSRGAAELDEVLDRLARHPATARHVTRKMARFFLGHEAPPSVAEHMARAFDGGNIRAALEVLVHAEALVDTRRPAFKDPVRYVLSSVRLLAEERPVSNALALKRWLVQLGEAPYHRQTPDGYPDTAEAWNGSGQMTARFDLARALSGGAPMLFDAAAGMATKPDESRPPGAGREGLTSSAMAQALAAQFSAATRNSLSQASTPQAWTALFLSAPEFMQR